MQKRQIVAGLMGMNQDIINPNVNTKLAFEIKNFRINATKNSNGVELTSEKSTLRVPVYDGSGSVAPIIENRSGDTIIGHCVLNQYLVIFICGSKNDYIKRLKLKNTYGSGSEIGFEQIKLFEGDLGFDVDHRIEAIACYENDDVLKVYWIDGINYPRVINIARKHNGIIGYQDFSSTDDPFSFYLKINAGYFNKIQVEKKYTGGMFYSGVIQYAFSFYNINGQETPIVYTTPLNYISHYDRGEEPNKQVGCSFKIYLRINPLDHDAFDYVRVYSIYRSSENSTPVVKVVKDVRCDTLWQDSQVDPSFYYIEFFDTNELGFDFDAYKILVSNDHIRPNAIAYKDKKLFLGNYTSDSIVTLKSDLTRVLIQWNVNSTKLIISQDYNLSILYPWKNQIGEYNSRNITTFKSNEWYKFGVQFLDIYGNWSLPYYIGTSYNDLAPITNSDNYQLPFAYTESTPNDIYTLLSNDEKSKYIRLRPVVSYPTKSERNVLCQGIVNPTVFNLGQRKNGICYALSSWFFRPYPNNYDNNDGKTFSGNSDTYHYKNSGYLLFKHFGSIHKSDSIAGELLNMYYDFSDIGKVLVNYQGDGSRSVYDTSGYTKLSTRPLLKAHEILRKDGDKYNDFYYVDQNVFTINSPEIDFDSNVLNSDVSQYKIRLVGCIKLYSQSGRYNIISSGPLFLNTLEKGENTDIYVRSGKLAKGFYNKACNIFVDNNYYHTAGGCAVSALNCWLDDICNIFQWDGDTYTFNNRKKLLSYYVYPWLRDHLNNYSRNIFYHSGNTDEKDGISIESETSKITRKVLSNIRVGHTQYFTTSYNLQTDSVRLFNKTEDLITKLSNDKFYQGNVNQLLSCSSPYSGLSYKQRDQREFDSYNTNWEYTEKIGYPFIIDNKSYSENPNVSYLEYDSFESVVDGSDPRVMNEGFINSGHLPLNSTPNDHSSDSIWIKYKSSPHIVAQISNNGILPICANSNIKHKIGYYLLGDPQTYDSISNVKLVWGDGEFVSITLDTYGQKNSSSSDDYVENAAYLWIGELYKYNSSQSSSNPYCSENEFDLENRVWVPCGDTYDFSDDTSTIKWLDGDTYFQRYDCLKTYPYSNDDYQSVVEIASFMVETHINLDGRYDLNRGLFDNTYINPTNFNLLNPVYGLKNNFFQYNILNQNAFNVNKFPTRFTWSLDKTNGQEIDEWTRTNTSAFYDCDGDKGELTSLRRFNNQIYAFLKKGISHIKYNENVAINTQNGVPIELGNSGSVNGVNYISETIGSQNKWSNISTNRGIFFVDNYTPGIYRLGGGEQLITNLTKNCMQRWFETRNSDGFIENASFDGNVNDVMFAYKNGQSNETLAFNTDYNVFSSLYDYGGTVGSIKNHSFNILEDKIYFLREGSGYNQFYASSGETNPYYVSFVANSNIEGFSPANCIYDNVWYDADVLSSSNDDNNFNYGELILNRNASNSKWHETFDEIEVANDYQYGIFNNTSHLTKYFEFIKKFRTWRVPVPRNKRFYSGGSNVHRDRMRSQWIKIKLTNNRPSSDKMVLRDIYVDSFS